MKKINVFYNGKPLRKIYPHATWFQVLKYRVRMFIRKMMILATLALIVYGAAEAYRYVRPVYVTQVEAKEVQVDPEYPVMIRIAKAESRNSHFCTDEIIAHKLCKKSEKGQVLTRGNTNGSVDVGRWQINVDVWGAKATELGYDIFTEQGNKDMAMWIYKNYGTEPWYSSKASW